MSDVIGQSSQAAQLIAASTREQSAGMDQIAQAMSQTNQATTALAAGAQESERAIAGLNEVAVQLGEISARFKVSA